MIRGRIYNRAKRRRGGDQKSKDQNDTLIDTAEKVAKEHGVSAPTIKRDGKYAEAVQKLEADHPGRRSSQCDRPPEPRRSLRPGYQRAP